MLSDEEKRKISELLKREPSDEEVLFFDALWSEHTSYKSSKIHLKRLPTTQSYVIQGPGENAGVIKVGKTEPILVAFKMESHNHPSYIEPYGGAATGVGGILRDVLSMGARPVALCDYLCFGSLDDEKMKYLLEKVVEGIADYGNSVGVPTVGGQTYFNRMFQGNIIVNVMCVGIVEGKLFKSIPKEKGLLLYCGSKTGRDGIGGASMASEKFSKEGGGEEEEKKSAVQIGDPFSEKCLIEATLEAMREHRDAILSVQDMGAAGLLNSSTEMASKGGFGVNIYLDRVPKREELKPYETLLSESQERMLFVLKNETENIEKIKAIFKKWELEAEIIGEMTDTGNLQVLENGNRIYKVPIDALVKNSPIYERATERPPWLETVRLIDYNKIPIPKKPEQEFLKVLLSANIASKQWIYTQYDYTVMTNTVVLPGADAAVIRVKGKDFGIALTCDCNPIKCFLDPREGAFSAVFESARNISCVGGKILAITNCLNFGNPEDPNVMWEFSETIDGISLAARKLGIAVVSGNVSFYNENNEVQIPPTPAIGAVGIIEDLSCIMNHFFKTPGDTILLIGYPRQEIGGSEYLMQVHGILGGSPPITKPDEEISYSECINILIKNRLLNSAHDVSEGGIITAIFESAAEKSLGVRLNRFYDERWDFYLFSETAPVYIVSCQQENTEKVKKIVESMGLFVKIIGMVVEEDIFSVEGLFSIKMSEIVKEWKNRIKKFLE